MVNPFIISLSTRGVIGQFSGPYFAVRPTKFEKSFFSARPINLRGKINILTSTIYITRAIQKIQL